MRSKKTETIIFGGGLDLVTPALKVEPGKLLQIKNYECDLNGGYKVAAGFERFDGSASPTGSSFFAIATSAFSGTYQLLETVTGTPSGATGILTTIGDEALYLVTITGTFALGDTLTGGTSTATSTAESTTFENVTASESEVLNDVRFDKEIYFRDLIPQVPGINAIRGVFRHEDITLVVRDFDGVEARMYKSTPTGWSQVTASHIIFFDTAVLSSAFPLPGTLLNDNNGNTATLHRVSFEIGTHVAGAGKGFIVVTGYTAGFLVGDPIRDVAAVAATTTEDAAAVTLKPGGKNEWRSHNFTGALEFYRLYTTDGVNPAMEYDPTADVLTPIYSDQLNRAADIPTFVEIYKNQLFIGFARGLMRNSEPGDPFLWDAALGTVEFAVGAEVTGFDAAPNSLIVATKRTTRALKGSTAEDFVFDVASSKTGATAYTMQHIGTTYMVDDRGIIELSRVQAFGDFENATVSRAIQPIIRQLRRQLVASTINLSNNIYKVFTADGRGIALTFQEGDITGYALYDYNVNINVMSNAEDENGDERIFFGGDSGFVYEQERGVSFDGQNKEAWLRTVFQYIGSQTLRKRFYRAFFDVEVSGRANVSITAEYTNGTPDVQPTDAIIDTLTGFDSAWDQGLWDSALFDATVVSDAYIDLTGTGDSISLIFYSTSDRDDVFTLKDVVYHYKPRRLLRNSR
ncbi:MAG: hypothetical protein MJK15_00865 [Colwellia sp.]|nr:hypothetical protein [Colwellia sp.]